MSPAAAHRQREWRNDFALELREEDWRDVTTVGDTIEVNELLGLMCSGWFDLSCFDVM